VLKHRKAYSIDKHYKTICNNELGRDVMTMAARVRRVLESFDSVQTNCKRIFIKLKLITAML